MAKRAKSMNPDKRSRLDLELFVLALVKHDINTPYSFRINVGLSPGATIPVLTRLQNLGFLRRGKSGVRRRAEYEITPSGSQHLRSGWRQLLKDPIPAEMDAILRVASLSMLSGAERGIIVAYLKRAATAKAADSRLRSRESMSLRNSAHALDSATLHAWMLAVHATSRLATEANILRQLARTIPMWG